MNKEQLQNHRKKLIEDFIAINVESVLENVPLLAKINGIFFPVNTILKEAKILLINKAILTMEKNQTSLPKPDLFSVDKLSHYIDSQEKGKHLVYGNKGWCSSGIKCRVHTAKETTTRCNKCTKYTHKECMYEMNCISCESDVIWQPYSEKGKR
jgi:hypothetical protein